jgi:hypothetical protein
LISLTSIRFIRTIPPLSTSVIRPLPSSSNVLKAELLAPGDRTIGQPGVGNSRCRRAEEVTCAGRRTSPKNERSDAPVNDNPAIVDARLLDDNDPMFQNGRLMALPKNE